MPKTIKNEETGQDEEVFSAEEVTARETIAVETAQAENQKVIDAAVEEAKIENQKRINEKEAELVKAKEDLAKAGDKDYNFNKLRDKVQTQEDEIKKLKDGLDTKVDEIKAGSVKEVVDEIIDGLSQRDEELKKKIQYHYNRLPEKPTTKIEISKKIDEAYLLATGFAAGNDPLRRAIPTGRGYVPSPNKKPLTPEQVELGKKMGITEEDAKKHGGQ